MMLRLLLLLGCLSACSSAWANHAAEVERLVKPLIDAQELVGCVVGVLDDGKQEIHSFGEVHRGQGDKPDGNTVYEIGSITKAFTGTLLADAANRGLLKLDAPLQDFLPAEVKLRAYEDTPIKLVDIASQSSGLPRMPSNMAPKDPKKPYVDYTAEQMFAFLRKVEPPRAPGAEYEYSNLGMGLLGTILARTAGTSYEELVRERICAPLKMDDTLMTLSAEQQSRFAPPYNAELGEEPTWEFDAFAGAGALRSTTVDMLKFAEAGLSDDERPIVKAIHEAWKPRFGKPGDIRVGLGWHLARDGVTWWHNGQTAGYSSALFVYPPKKLAVVVLANTASRHTTALAEKLLLAMLGQTPDPIATRNVAHVDSEILKKYVGKYLLSFVFAIDVTYEDGRLMAQATNQEKFQLFPESETKFFYKVVDAQITFEKAADGIANKLTLHQNGRDLPGVRIPDAGEAQAK